MPAEGSLGRAFRGSTHNEVSQEALGTQKVAAVEVSGVPAGSLGAGIIFPNYPQLRSGDWDFVASHQPVTFA